MYSTRKRTTSNSSKKKKIILIVVGILVIGAAVVAALEQTNKINLFKSGNPTTQSADGINYDPPTEQDLEDVEKKKEDIVKDQENQQTPTPPPTAGNKKSVKPIIVRASNGEVSGYIAGIFEDGGTCTAVFKSGSTEITKSSSSIADATTTICAPISYAGTAVQPGWSVTLRYESGASQGVSDAATIQ